jgi:hypothetical protein
LKRIRSLSEVEAPHSLQLFNASTFQLNYNVKTPNIPTSFAESPMLERLAFCAKQSTVALDGDS